MNKKAIKYLALIVSVSVLAQGPSAAAGFPETATASTAEKREINTVRANTDSSSARDDVVQVIMPVNVDHVFDFIMDPQELIKQTDAAAYDGKQFEEDATLFFKRSDDGTEDDYSSSSDVLTIANGGDVDVTVILTASISPDSISGITMSDDPEFPDNTDASLYLALTDGETTVPIDIENGAEIEAEIYGISEGEEPNEYSFQLIGAVNKEGDWSKVTDVAPRVTVTWKVSTDEEDVLEEKESEAEEGLAGAGRSTVSEESAPAESVPTENKPDDESREDDENNTEKNQEDGDFGGDTGENIASPSSLHEF